MKTLPTEFELFELTLPVKMRAYGLDSSDEVSSVLVRMHDENGQCGWGGAIARRSLTGETLETIQKDLQEIIWPAITGFESVEDLRCNLLKIPAHNEERIFTAARCAAVTALINLMDFDWFGPLAATHEKYRSYIKDNLALTPTCGEIIIADDEKTALKRAAELIKKSCRHFRLIFSGDNDTDMAIAKAISAFLADSFGSRNSAHFSLIADICGKWKYNEVIDYAHLLAGMGFNAIADPCPVRIGVLSHLAWDSPLPVIAHSSCITEAQLDVALGAEGKIWPQISVEKCGGPDILANMSLSCANGRTPWVFGCDQLQNGLLSIIQRETLKYCSAPILIESCRGFDYLKDDCLLPRPRLGRGGVLNMTNAAAAMLRLDSEKFAKYAQSLIKLDKMTLQRR